MAEGREPRTTDKDAPIQQQSLGDYLTFVRNAKKMTLREVEEASGKQISNAYLSQLETGRITKPSPHVLYALSAVYAIPYERLMEKAGYLMPASGPLEGKGKANPVKHGRVATFADENLTQQEEEELLKYLAFLRSQRKRRGV